MRAVGYWQRQADSPLWDDLPLSITILEGDGEKDTNGYRFAFNGTGAIIVQFGNFLHKAPMEVK